MNLIRKLAVVIIALAGTSVAQADLIVVDFEDTEEGAFLPTVTSRGFTFTGSENPGGFPLMAVRDSATDTTGCAPCVDNDSRYLVHSDGGQPGRFPIITMTADNAIPFRLLSFDFAEDQLGARFAERIEVTGFRNDGTTVFAQFYLDGINDGSGGLDDFQTAIVTDQFRNLISVQFFGPVVSPGENDDETKAFSLDNIRIVQVPEPITIDIKPGSDPNSVNPKSKGVIPVAILGSGDLDALQVTGISCGDTEATLSGETFSGDAVTGTDSVKAAGCK